MNWIWEFTVNSHIQRDSDSFKNPKTVRAKCACHKQSTNIAFIKSMFFACLWKLSRLRHFTDNIWKNKYIKIELLCLFSVLAVEMHRSFRNIQSELERGSWCCPLCLCTYHSFSPPCSLLHCSFYLIAELSMMNSFPVTSSLLETCCYCFIHWAVCS